MEYIYSALVLHAAGKAVDEDAIANVLKSAGVEPDAAKIKSLTASLEGVNMLPPLPLLLLTFQNQQKKRRKKKSAKTRLLPV